MSRKIYYPKWMSYQFFFISKPNINPSYASASALMVEAVEFTFEAAPVIVFNTDINLSALKTKLILEPNVTTFATTVVPNLPNFKVTVFNN